jgi:CRISPR-associated protein Cas1
MTSLYVDRRGVVMSLDADAIAFHQAGARIGTVPIGPLERVYLRGDIQISASLLGRLGAHGLAVVILSGRRGEPTMLMPRPHNDARTRLAQLDAARCEAHALKIAAHLVEGKIGAQRQLLLRIATGRPELGLGVAGSTLARMQGQVRTKTELAALRGLEGAAAAVFFGAYTKAFAPSLGFCGRNRRPPRDPVNAALSLAYTLLQADTVIAAHGHGFDPMIGFLHGIDFGRDSFACDLAEPLRPVMEGFVWRLFAEQTLRVRDFSLEPDGACLLQKAGRQRFYEAVDTPLADCRKRLDRMLTALRRMLVEADDRSIGVFSGGAEDESVSAEL